MGTTTKRVGKDGEVSFQAKVRKNGVKQSATFATQKQADEWVTDTEAKINKGQSVSIHEVRKLTLGAIFTDYIKNNTLPKNKFGNLERLKIEIGSIRLEQFTTKVLGNYLKIKLGQALPTPKNKKKDHPLFKGGMKEVEGEDGVMIKVQKTYAPATVRHYYYDIRTALEWHAQENSYHFNSKPFDDKPPPAAWEKPRERRLEEGELESLMSACDRMYKYRQDWKDLINFQTLSGMRIGETLLMRWRDLVIDEKEPHGSYVFVPKENQKTKGSNKADDRFVSMRRELHALVIQNLLTRKGKPEERVFPYWKHSGIVGHGFRTITKNAKTVDLNVHDFRHEAISWFFENTMLTDIEIAKMTGHTEMDTLRRYAKLRPQKTGAKLWAGMPQVA